MARFMTRRDYIEAVPWTGENRAEVLEFDPRITFVAGADQHMEFATTHIGLRKVGAGNHIIRYGNGELGPCDSNVFGRLYEPAE